MTYCKVGDLAIVVHDDALQENLGLIVRVISSAGMKNWYPYSKRLKRWHKRAKPLFSWHVESLSSRGICYSDRDDCLFYCHSGEIPDVDLRPLASLDEADEVLREAANPMQGAVDLYEKALMDSIKAARARYETCHRLG